MTETAYSFRYWIVECLNCRNPIPLFVEPKEDHKDAGAVPSRQDRPYFRAWCTNCSREYPYLSTAMVCTDEPPLDKERRPIEFTRIRQRVQVQRAGA
jgi:hypothetical protein